MPRKKKTPTAAAKKKPTAAAADTKLKAMRAELEAQNKEAYAERAREEDGTYVADDPTTPDVNEAWTPGRAEVAVSQRALAVILNVPLEGITITEAYNGIGFKTEDGLYGVCMRDSGVELMLDGKQVWPASTSFFPTTVFDADTNKDMYTLDVDGCAGGNHPADQGDGFPATITMRMTHPGLTPDDVEHYIRGPVAPMAVPLTPENASDELLLDVLLKRYTEGKTNLRLRQALALVQAGA